MYPKIDEILKDPVLSFSFESYLRSNMSHKSLLFIEAVNQIRCGASQDIEESLLRYNKLTSP